MAKDLNTNSQQADLLEEKLVQVNRKQTTEPIKTNL
jgi:hypothetical protein